MIKRHPYLAIIFDLKKTPRYEYFYDDKDKTKKFNGYDKEYSNKRWILFCPCGCVIETSQENIREIENVLTFVNEIVCKNCFKSYFGNSPDVRIIYSKSPNSNVVSRRFGLVEKERFYALYSFATTMFVSATTKRIVFKDIGDCSLYLSKKIRAIQIKKGEKIITIPFRFLVKHCSSVVNYMSLNVLYDNLISQENFERQFVNPLLNFCKIIESKCDSRDVERILLSLDREREKVYMESFFKDVVPKRSRIFGLFHEKKELSYEMDFVLKCGNNLSPNRYIWLQYLKRRLCVMLSIYMYPPLATIAINYSTEHLLNLLTDSSLMCSLTDLRKKNPTNPKDIIETMFKRKVVSEIGKSKKIKEYLRKEKKKIQRKIKSQPDNEKELKRIKNNISHHPDIFIDSRIEITKDTKKNLGNIHFKKVYVDFFLENFDKSAQVFYKFLSNRSVFDSIETIEKTISKYGVETAAPIIHAIDSCFRLIDVNAYVKFRLNYNNVSHIIKILEQDNKIQASFLIQIYGDIISMMKEMDIPVTDILRTKTKKELDDLHTALNNSYEIRKDKKISEELKLHMSKYKHTECVINEVQFALIDTPEKFYNESKSMNHCVKTYCSSTAKGQYVIYSIEDLETQKRATLSINVSEVSLEGSSEKTTRYSFNQLKSKNNERASEKIIISSIRFIDKFFEIKVQDESKYDLKLETEKEEKSLEEKFLEINPQEKAANDNIIFEL